MSLPYFPMYPRDFEADTSHLTLEEDGAYNRLLRLCWMTPEASLPDDDAWIMRRMRVDEATFIRVVKVVLAEFFVRQSGRVSNARMTREFIASSDAHAKRVSAGKSGGNAKAMKTNKSEPSNAKAMLKQPEPEPEPYKEDLGKPKSLAFSEFWACWPNKTAKAAAEKAWRSLSQPDRICALENAAPWFNDWRKRHPDASPIHPATYLNKKRWTDEQQQPINFNGDAYGSRPTPRPGDGRGTFDAFAAVAARYAGPTQ